MRNRDVPPQRLRNRLFLHVFLDPSTPVEFTFAPRLRGVAASKRALVIRWDDNRPRTGGAGAAPYWLLRQRVTVPAPPARFFHRPELARRCRPADRALTLLMAPGGFGKTTLLGAGCRAAAAGGAAVAWLTLADDAPEELDTYLAFAFGGAGLGPLRGRGEGAARSRLAHSRTAVLLGALAGLRRPFVLALDELESVTDPRSVALLNFVLANAPPCLHLALAGRALPGGLDAAVAVAGAEAEILTAEDFRFSKAEIARFFDLSLSRRELVEVAAESGGWPIALQMRRNAPRADSGEAVAMRDALGTWIGGGFWRGFAEPDRELVLDLALFDWLDEALVEAVLERPGALRLATALPGLAGLLLAAPGAPRGTWRLHPLLREHCADKRRRDTPDRYRAVHRRIADALAGRGATVEAMRHAVEARDPHRAGEILLEAGGMQWWLREGSARLAAACRYLTDAAVAASPRLALIRCMPPLFEGRIREAGRALDAVCERGAPGDPEFAMDRVLARGVLAMNGSVAPGGGEAAALLEEVARLAARPSTGRVTRGALMHGRAVERAHRARFEDAVRLGSEIRGLVLGRSTYLTLGADLLLGQVAMARGQAEEAGKRYRGARRLARTGFLEDPRMGALAEVLARELAYERGRLAAHAGTRRLVRDLYRSSVLFVYFVAGAELAVGLELEDGGAEAALAAIGEMRERARGAGIGLLVRHLDAFAVSVLADAGRTAEAQRVWRAGGLPQRSGACLELREHGWRGVEALGCARVRLLAARGDIGAAADVQRSLSRLAGERGLRRTLMRVLALRLRLCRLEGDRDGERAAALEYLGHFAETGYARALLREGEAATAVLGRLATEAAPKRLAVCARRLLAMGGRGGASTVPYLDEREMAVLRGLDGARDKAIARALGLSVHGVRYHVGKIFRKLGVSGRREAVRRARALGILPARTPSGADGAGG